MQQNMQLCEVQEVQNAKLNMQLHILIIKLRFLKGNMQYVTYEMQKTKGRM